MLTLASTASKTYWKLDFEMNKMPLDLFPQLKTSASERHIVFKRYMYIYDTRMADISDPNPNIL